GRLSPMSEFDRDQRPSRSENEYFAREDVEALRRLSQKQAHSLQSEEREALKSLHYLKCPKCGFDLHTLRHGEIDIETCFNCHGIWLDAGELEHIVRQQRAGRHSVVDAVLNLFKNAR